MGQDDQINIKDLEGYEVDESDSFASTSSNLSAILIMIASVMTV